MTDGEEMIAAHVKGILSVIPGGIREGTDDTPQRVAKMYMRELFAGYETNVDELFRTFDHEGYDGMVVVKDVPVISLCEHHLVPFVGWAHVGYFPNGKVLGLSKVARVINAYARRLQIQERLTKQVADTLVNGLNPRGVIVVIEAEHMCITIRGAQAPGTKAVTSAVRGLFNHNQEGEKEEFFRLIGR
jgi:GTP cyclohydrolase IA